MNWHQYWQFQWMNFEVSLVVYAVIFVLAAIGFAGFIIYDKIQDWRGR